MITHYRAMISYTMCASSMGVVSKDTKRYQRVQVPCRQVGISLLASDKVVNREVRTEGSQTAKAGTDEQKRHIEAIENE
jgi:hypothetical protein